MSLLSVQRVSKAFPDAEKNGLIWALRDVSLTVRGGEFICLLGPSGSGKTTLLNLMAGFIRPTEGEVRIAGQPVRGPGPDRGVVFQQYGLFPWMTVIENVAFGLRNQGLSRKQSRTHALDHLQQVGLTEFAHAHPHQLSGGMQQRVAIARVWALQSPILLMDEPFGALDVGTRSRMQQHLLSVWEGSRRTIVFITHNVSEAVSLGDRIVVFSPRPGRIVGEVAVRIPHPRSDFPQELTDYQKEIVDILRGQWRTHNGRNEHVPTDCAQPVAAAQAHAPQGV